MKRLLAIVLLVSLSACASARGRHNVAKTFEVVGTTLTGAGVVSSGSGAACWGAHQFIMNEDCEKMLMAGAATLAAGNLILFIATPARKRAQEQMKLETQLAEKETKAFLEALQANND